MHKQKEKLLSIRNLKRAILKKVDWTLTLNYYMVFYAKLFYFDLNRDFEYKNNKSAQF
jgi:hypothetical protein